jgi:4-hydroxy-2-oxoheptanedioate aldolase
MPGFTLRSRLRNGEQLFGAWIVSGSARIAETVVSVGFDFGMFDLQHGEAGFTEARDAIAALRHAGKPAGLRAGLEGHAEAARLLDLGAEIAVMPMISSVEDARRLVDTLKYPPVGARSWGPTRAINLFETTIEEYRHDAVDGIIVLAMIETTAAVDNLEAILDVPGLDGVFVGPSDLSISLSRGEKLDHRLPEAVAVMERVVAGAKARGKASAIFCAGAEAAARNAALGFDILAVGSDWGFLMDGARAALEAARGSAQDGAARY